MKSLQVLLNELEKKTSNYRKENKTISTASIGWHIAHITLVIVKIIEQLETSDPSTYKWKFNKKRLLVFTLKKIPRGIAKAPKAVQVQDVFNEEKLILFIEKARLKVVLLNQLKPSHNFEHPYFGSLNLKGTLNFLEIHTNHHLKIIKDIINK